MLKIHINIDDFMILFYVDLRHRTDRTVVFILINSLIR